MDQMTTASGLPWRCLSTLTLASEGQTSVSAFKQNKDSLTILTCANAPSTQCLVDSHWQM